MTETETKLIEVLTRGLKLRTPPGGGDIRPDTPIFGKQGLGLDSVDVLEVAVLLDKHFNVQLEEESVDVRTALATIGSLAAYIDSRKK